MRDRRQSWKWREGNRREREEEKRGDKKRERDRVREIDRVYKGAGERGRER